MKSKETKKTKEKHAAGVREHSRKYSFPVKQKIKNEEERKKPPH